MTKRDSAKTTRQETQDKTMKWANLGDWEPSRRKRDPMQLLAESVRGRVEKLLPLKTERMLASPFGYFRGAACVMAYDLSLFPHTGVVNQLCGDAHVENLGAYSGLDGRLIFDINDFDESVRGPFEWDVKRMATSLLLAGAQANLKSSAAETAAEDFLTSYRGLIKRFAKMPVLDVARFQVHRLRAEAPIVQVLRKAERATPLRSREALMEKKASGWVFRNRPPVLRRVGGAERAAALGALRGYKKSLLPERQHFFSQFRAVDVGFKVVGTGSVGMRDYCIYLEGNSHEDVLFLQIKEETQSAYNPYLPKSAGGSTHNGQRVADGQRAMQLQSDPLLGWTSVGRRDYLVRQLSDHKASLDVTKLNAVGLAEYARVCGELLARGHARSGDARQIAATLRGGKRFRKAMLSFASRYAMQTDKDWQALASQQKRKGKAKA